MKLLPRKKRAQLIHHYILSRFSVDELAPASGGGRHNSTHTFDSFKILRFIFETRFTEFSFMLDEIRLVAEPSAA